MKRRDANQEQLFSAASFEDDILKIKKENSDYRSRLVTTGGVLTAAVAVAGLGYVLWARTLANEEIF